VAEAVVQGLAGELRAPHWPALTAAELAPVLATFGLDEPIAVRWHSPRPWTAAAIVDTASQSVFVKRHDPRVRDREALLAEHAFVRHLRDHGIPTPSALPAGAGDSVASSDRWLYEVFTLAPGEDRYRDRHSWTPYLSGADAHAAGAMLARLHNASDGYDRSPAGTERPLSNPLRLLRRPDLTAGIDTYVSGRPALETFLADRPWAADISASLRSHHARLVPLLAAQPSLWGHGDWHGSNLTWQGSKALAIIDFGLADRTCAAFDLATAIERAAISWLDLVHGREPDVAYAQVDAILDGYVTTRAIDRAAVAAFLPLVHVELALSELDYFTRITPDAEDAEHAYRYLVDHLRWFAGPGRALLDHLE
jgi:Ser/Thr protein kinase RdoA (MazF antagonist)